MAGFNFARRIRQQYFDLRIFMRYGTLNPRVVTLADGRHELSIDPGDPRCRKKIAADGIRGKQRRNQVFWRTAVNALKPNVALDIGVNFGECLFHMDYPQCTLAYGIDGNPALLPYLEESRELHPQTHQIRLHNALVAEQPAKEATFYVSKKASGGSTASAGVAEMGDSDFQEARVPVTSVDTLLSTLPKKIVFKIDVEGFEGRVLRGMQKTLAGCQTALGFIEFDTQMLDRSGEDVSDLWDFLQANFDVHMFVEDRLVSLLGTDWSGAAGYCAEADDHTDLLLIGGSNRELARKFVQTQFVESKSPA